MVLGHSYGCENSDQLPLPGSLDSSSSVGLREEREIIIVSFI